MGRWHDDGTQSCAGCDAGQGWWHAGRDRTAVRKEAEMVPRGSEHQRDGSAIIRDREGLKSCVLLWTCEMSCARVRARTRARGSKYVVGP